jgi:hypothetical protein
MDTVEHSWNKTQKLFHGYPTDIVEHPWNISKIAECDTGERRRVGWGIFPNFPHFGWGDEAQTGENKGIKALLI